MVVVVGGGGGLGDGVVMRPGLYMIWLTEM